MSAQTQQVKAVAIGQQVAEMLNLKIGRDGRMKTQWGTKSIEGLGNCIMRIYEEETERLKDFENEG